MIKMNKCLECIHSNRIENGGLFCTRKNLSVLANSCCDRFCDSVTCKQHENQTQTHDPVSRPKHYTHGGIECIDAIKEALGKHFMGFLIGNVIKYVWRYPLKNGVEDLKKARWYLDRAIKEMEHEPQ